MKIEVPPRDDWVNAPLLEKSPCGPFPDFTDFENKALECIASRLTVGQAELRRQISAAKVVDRIHTGVGFYTRIEIDRLLCEPADHEQTIKSGGCFSVAEPERYFWVLLWWDDGYLRTIEGITSGDDNLDGIELEHLQFVRFND